MGSKTDSWQFVSFANLYWPNWLIELRLLWLMQSVTFISRPKANIIELGRIVHGFGKHGFWYCFIISKASRQILMENKLIFSFDTHAVKFVRTVVRENNPKVTLRSPLCFVFKCKYFKATCNSVLKLRQKCVRVLYFRQWHLRRNYFLSLADYVLVSGAFFLVALANCPGILMRYSRTVCPIFV